MAFIYKLEHEDGTPADPPTFRTRREHPGTPATRSRSAAHELSAFLISVLDENLDGEPVPVLVVEDLPGSATSAVG